MSFAQEVMNLRMPLFELTSQALLECAYSRADETFRLTLHDVFAVGVEQRDKMGMLHELVLQELETANVLSVHEQTLCIQERYHDPTKGEPLIPYLISTDWKPVPQMNSCSANSCILALSF